MSIQPLHRVAQPVVSEGGKRMSLFLRRMYMDRRQHHTMYRGSTASQLVVGHSYLRDGGTLREGAVDGFGQAWVPEVPR